MISPPDYKWLAYWVSQSIDQSNLQVYGQHDSQSVTQMDSQFVRQSVTPLVNQSPSESVSKSMHQVINTTVLIPNRKLSTRKSEASPRNFVHMGTFLAATVGGEIVFPENYRMTTLKELNVIITVWRLRWQSRRLRDMKIRDSISSSSPRRLNDSLTRGHIRIVLLMFIEAEADNTFICGSRIIRVR